MITTKSARVAITLATANGRQTREPSVTAPAYASYSSNDAVAHSLDCGQIVGAIDRCREPVRKWLLLTYGAHGCVNAEQTAAQLVAALYQSYTAGRRTRMKAERIRKLAAAVIADMSCRYGRPALPITKKSAYTRAIELSVYRYKDIAHIITAMKDIVETWDIEGLQIVSERLPCKVIP